MAGALSDAFGAALTKDAAHFKATLNNFFVESSVNLLLYEVLSPISGEDAAGKDTEKLAPLIQCLAEGLAEQSVVSSRCKPGTEQAVKDLKDALGVVGCGTPASLGIDTDCHVIDRVIARVSAGQAVVPADAARALAAVMTSPTVQRADLRSYLLNFAELLEQGMESGLFRPTAEFLEKQLHDEDTVQELIKYNPLPPTPHFGHALASAANDGEFAQALKDCGQPLDAFNEWTQVRAKGFIDKQRRALLKGEPVDATPYQKLMSYACPSPPAGGGTAAQTVTMLRQNAAFEYSALVVYNGLTRYAVPLLAAAALLDYVRNSDVAVFDDAVRRIVAFAVRQLTVRALMLRDLEAEEAAPTDPSKRIQKLRPLKDALTVCEVQDILFFLSPQAYSHPAAGTVCFAFKSRAVSIASDVSPYAIPATGLTPALRAQRAERLAEATSGFLEGLQALTSTQSSLRELEVGQLLRVAAFTVEGRDDVARKSLARFGVDLLVAQVDRRSSSMLGVTEKACEEDRRTTSIFEVFTDSKVGACVALVLIRSAYFPIADFLWEQGFKESTAEELATRTYTSLAQSRSLDSMPFIFNVGLGANYIMPLTSNSVWRDGYGALTVVDKFGLAFYKYNGRSTQLEFGLFAGGFLDALVRTVADTGEDERYWLTGLTLGAPRMWGKDIGLEGHVGFAMPFSFNNRDRFGWTVGATLVVPVSAVLGEKE
ncbi:hypothetical protein ACN28E_05635 [Archangium lansingense]|uniref:hypothetical protein n=1 Tax=Archangium lansingense TaxID=2995310 RepID=UPI003B802D81